LANKGINIFITDFPQYRKYLYFEPEKGGERIRIALEKGLIVVYNPYNSAIWSEIYDIIGRKISVHYLAPGLNLLKVNLSNGIYFIRSKDEVIKFLYVK
jgi:hypothetical protein